MQHPDTLEPDQLTPDTGATVAPDSSSMAEQMDTLVRMSTPSLVGTYDHSLPPERFLTQEDLHWLDYRYLGGILEQTPGVFARDQHSIGQYNQLNIRGADWRSIAITANGRLMNDPATGVFNLFHFAPEYADRIEFLSGPRAFLYALNASGGAINLVTKNYNSNRPFSKINYTESAYEYQYSDGTFSQNISRKINFTFGFQHQSTDGRFANSAHESWNWRVKLRYNLSRDFNVILSEYYTTTITQLNGGVDIGASGVSQGLDPLRATVRNAEAKEETDRHDVDLSFVGTLLGDTSNVSMLTLYYSENLREYRDEQGGSPSNGVFIKSDHRSTWLGALFTQNFDTEFQRFNIGANFETRQIKGSPNLGAHKRTLASLWVKEEFLLTGLLTVAGFSRYDHHLGETYLGLGTDATLRPTDGISLFGGISFSRRLPNYQELYWMDSTVSRIEPMTAEKHRQVEVGAVLRPRNVGTFRVAYFHRTVEDAIRTALYGSSAIFPGVLFSNAGTVTSNGIEASAGFWVWMLYFEGTGTYLVQQSGGATVRDLPKLFGNGGVFFWKTMFNDNLNLKVGFRGKYISSSRGQEFNPEVVAYVPGTGPALGQGSTIDFLMIARIDKAYLHLTWENLSNTRYFATPYYPVLDRAVHFGVSWQFLD